MENFEPYMCTTEMYQNTYLFDINHLSIEELILLDNFRKDNSIKSNVIDLAGLWTEFMFERLECNSCSVDAKWFPEFYKFLVERESELSK